MFQPSYTRLPSRGPGGESFVPAWLSALLVGTVWLSAGIFGAYILAAYGGALSDGQMSQWNRTLPRLYELETPLATVAIGLHLLCGGVLLLLGPVQLLGAVRARFAGLHRQVGRLFVGSAAVASLGGLVFIVGKGTVGGVVMDLGFGLYGTLTLAAAVQTIRCARARRWAAHRHWGIRLFALVIGSWLYRIEYGVWFTLTEGVGHTKEFGGVFDQVMAFAFYLPNLLVAEWYLRADNAAKRPSKWLAWGATSAVALATAFLLVGTYFFSAKHWGPPIAERLTALVSWL